MPFLNRHRSPTWIRRRDQVRQRALLALTRSRSVICPFAVMIPLMIDLVWERADFRTQTAFLALVVLHACFAWIGLRVLRHEILSPSRLRLAYMASVAGSGMFGLLWIALTLIITDRPLQGFLVPILIYGGLLIAPCRAGALLYTLVVTIGDIVWMPSLPGSDHRFQVLAAIYGLTAAAMIVWQNAEFVRRVQNEMDLEEKSEIIGILLHDFEEQGSDWLWETDADLHLRAPSERLLDILACTRTALVNLSLHRWIGARLRLAGASRDGFATLNDCIEARLPFRGVRIPIGAGDQERWLLLTGKPVFNPDGSFRGYRGVGSDITAARRSEQRVAWLGRHDSLTRLPNRAHFHEALEQACGGQVRTGQSLALLCLDLDGFKAVNDTLGHLAGDTLLAQVADRLRSCIRGRDLIGRLGGDEFALLLHDTDRPGAETLARRLMDRIAEPYEIDGLSVGIGVSIGIMLSPDESAEIRVTEARELLKGADLAMYRAKQDGRGTIRVFDASMHDNVEQRLMLRADLRHAISRDQLLLHFQPIMDGMTGRVIAAEALVRWMHPVRGLIPPADFIPIAEDCGLIGKLGAWVLDRACREAARWEDGIGVSVNLSPIQLRDPSLCGTVDDALRESGLPPERLELEITESLLLDPNPTVRETLERLKQRGVRIALDDFGTGFSSLSYLRNFPVDTLKIDRSFVRDLGSDLEADMIVQAITGMANGLGITITAEGVETADQAARLRASGCTQFQGFFYSRPCNADAVRRFIAVQNALAFDAAPAPALEGPVPAFSA